MITAAYLRVSSRLTADGECRQSTQSQETALRAFCKANRIKPAWYLDHATGRTVKRPGLQRLLQDCKDHKVNRIIVTDLSRLSRQSVKDTLTLVETLTAQGISICCINQNITFDQSSMSQFLLACFSALSRLESDIRSERVRNGLAVRRAKHLPIGRQRDLQKRQQVADMRRQGTSVRQIAASLKVSRQAIYRLLTA